MTPDMPGYGDSTARNVSGDYKHETIILGLLALLNETGRSTAVWAGHDWGAGVASSLVATHPEVVTAMAWLDVPYHMIERGLVDTLPYVNQASIQLTPEPMVSGTIWSITKKISNGPPQYSILTSAMRFERF